MIKLYNTLTRKVEDFKPINPPNVGMYACGPTVYWSAHIGHMSKYVGDDILRRVLTYNGYQVKHVMNVTDVGHLTSDADEGEDKMEKGAKREGLTVWEIAKKYEKEFFQTMEALNVLRPDVVCRATEHIAEQIELIKRLEAKGFTYQTDSAVYFDVDKFPKYWSFTGQKLADKKIAAREDVVVDLQKKHPYDFALWFKRVGRFANHIMHWNSPWGDGFPGWHIECSAMSMKYLSGEQGRTIDIHTGGIDHLGVHHPAEIAQSEGATGKPFVRYWVHRVFITVGGKKMSKSLDNFYTLEDVIKKGFDPLDLRYLFLTTHYRQTLDFTWEALTGAQNAHQKLVGLVRGWRGGTHRQTIGADDPEKIQKLRQRFVDKINRDLCTPEALAVVWEMAKSDLPAPEKLDLILDFDQVLGLRLAENSAAFCAPTKVQELVKKREELRQQGKWAEADKLRRKIEKCGCRIEDTPEGTKVKPI